MTEQEPHYFSIEVRPGINVDIALGYKSSGEYGKGFYCWATKVKGFTERGFGDKPHEARADFQRLFGAAIDAGRLSEDELRGNSY